MQPANPQFEALLNHLKETRGFDFTGYKRSSLVRRVTRRMSQIGITGFAEYLDFLQVHPDEFTVLFNTILINVTGFFRDAETWDFLRTEVLEPLAQAKAGAPIRAWTAGCASGQEAYTLAMALAEVLGPEAFRDQVKIYATDVDEKRLDEARQAAYRDREMRAVPPELASRYFEPVGNRFAFRKDLRRSVIFGRNDLVQDAPISRVDLLTCRNTLMYFNAETQAKILNRFHFALAESGVLFLGKAEMLLGYGSMFTPLDLDRRVFRRVPRLMQAQGVVLAEPASTVKPRAGGLDELRDEAIAASPLAQLGLTTDGMVAITNRELEKMFGISSGDVGRPFRDLELSYRPVELRGSIERAQVERRSLRISEVQHVRGTETAHLEVQISPLTGADGRLLGVNVSFHDVTAARRLQDELSYANQQLEAAYEELQSTNEEVETTNEELQSTVEELETTNEELQSTNEELETMNEELQSTNDELQSMNEQLRIGAARLDEANSFLEIVLTSLDAGVAVIDQELRVRMWNQLAEELWGVPSAEALGEHFLALDIGLPFDLIRPTVRAALGPGAVAGVVQVDGVSRRGRPIRVRVVCTPLRNLDGSLIGEGAIIVMEPEAGQRAQAAFDPPQPG